MPRVWSVPAAPPRCFRTPPLGRSPARAAYQFRNTSGQEWTAAFGVNPGYTISNVRANGAEVPFSVSDYQEYNEAMLEVTLPSDGRWS